MWYYNITGKTWQPDDAQFDMAASSTSSIWQRGSSSGPFDLARIVGGKENLRLNEKSLGVATLQPRR